MEQHTNTLNGTSELHPIRTLHLFAGAGGGILADLLLGHRPVCAVEIDQHCQQVLSQRQKDGVLPWFPIFGDVTTFDGRPWRGLVEAVCGGFPCQDISTAGAGAGIDGERSGLWQHQLRIIREILPRYAFVENSPMLTVRGIRRVLGDLAEVGYNAKWGVLGASDSIWRDCDPEADHERYRIWILAVPNTASKRWAKTWELRFNESEKRSGRIRQKVSNSTSIRQPRSRESGESEHSAKTPARKADRAFNGSEGNVRWWNSEPGLDRVAHGVADRMERLRAIGNGQVPIVAATAWNILKP